MSKIPNTVTNEYSVLVDIIKKRFEKHNLLFTENKENIFKILFENENHLSVNEVVEIFNTKFNLVLKVSTAYRSLSSFESLGIVNHIIIDDIKRYELVYFKAPHYHLYCQECNGIEEFESKEIHQVFLNHLEEIGFQAINFNVIVNGVCKRCQK